MKVEITRAGANERVAKVLAQLVKESGRSQTTIAAEAGMSRPALWSHLREPRPYKISTLSMIAKLTGFRCYLVFEKK